MLILMLAAMAAQSPTPVAAPATTTAPDIVISRKPRLVCTTVHVTGSRAKRARHCVTSEQAAIEREQAQEAIRQGGSLQAVRDAIACGPPSIQSCN